MEQNQKSMDVGAVSADAGTQEGASSGTGKPTKKRAADRANRDALGSGNKEGSAAQGKSAKPAKPSKPSNRVRETRIERMMSKAELARRAGLSVLTIDRVEKGLECRMDTKRKILEALGLSLGDRVRVFGEEE
jgi:DNA-binding XRE family transcriptional regulator